MTTIGLYPVDEVAMLEMAANAAANQKINNIDRDVESPVDPRPFSSDAANNYYNAMTTRSILKKKSKPLKL